MLNLAMPGLCPQGFELLEENDYCVADPGTSAATALVVPGLSIPSRWRVAVAAVNAVNADVTDPARSDRLTWAYVTISVLSGGEAPPMTTQLEGSAAGGGQASVSWPEPTDGEVYGLQVGYRQSAINMTECMDGYRFWESTVYESYCYAYVHVLELPNASHYYAANYTAAHVLTNFTRAAGRWSVDFHGLAEPASYDLMLWQYNVAGVTYQAVKVQVGAVLLPGDPTNFAYAYVSETQAHLTWGLSTPGTYPIVAYLLSYEDVHDPRPCGPGSTARDSNGFVLCDVRIPWSGAAASGEWTLDGLLAGHRYHFYLHAIDAANNYNLAHSSVYWQYHQSSASHFSTPTADLSGLQVAFNQPVTSPPSTTISWGLPSSDGGSRIGGFNVWNQDHNSVGCPVGWSASTSAGWCYLWVVAVNGQTSYTVVAQWAAGVTGGWQRFGVASSNGAGHASTHYPTAAQTTGSNSADGMWYQLP